jgi:hypothetical protein
LECHREYLFLWRWSLDRPLGQKIRVDNYFSS